MTNEEKIFLLKGELATLHSLLNQRKQKAQAKQTKEITAIQQEMTAYVEQVRGLKSKEARTKQPEMMKTYPNDSWDIPTDY